MNTIGDLNILLELLMFFEPSQVFVQRPNASVSIWLLFDPSPPGHRWIRAGGCSMMLRDWRNTALKWKDILSTSYAWKRWPWWVVHLSLFNGSQPRPEKTLNQASFPWPTVYVFPSFWEPVLPLATVFSERQVLGRRAGDTVFWCGDGLGGRPLSMAVMGTRRLDRKPGVRWCEQIASISLFKCHGWQSGFGP